MLVEDEVDEPPEEPLDDELPEDEEPDSDEEDEDEDDEEDVDDSDLAAGTLPLPDERLSLR
nr:hypothetical protein [Kribbella capetownensis]